MGQSASPDEASAIAAAIARFEAENAPAPDAAPRVNPWQRAALVEGVEAKQSLKDIEGGNSWLS